MAVSEDLGELTIRPPRIPPTLTSFTLAMVVLLLTCGIAWFLYGQARDALVSEIRMGLQRSATLAAQRVDGDAHARLLAPGARKDSADYEAQNRTMHELAAADPEIAYAYTAIERDGQVWLVLDTEPPDGPDDMAVLQALNPKDNQPFDHNDEVMLAALAGQAAIALERERLNQSAQERRKLEEALKFAQSIQLGMLPHKFPDPASAGIKLHAELIPAKMVGGDFYDFVWIDDDRLGLVVADVSGKGIPAALLMAKAMTMIRDYLGATRDPEKALAQANEELAEDNDAAMFVTAFAAIYDRRRRELVYSNAGHNEPYVLRAGQIHALGKAKSVPLGAQPGMRFDNAGARLALGDVLFLYTDGVIEAMDLDYQEYGEQRLRQFLVKHVDRPMPELTRACIDSVRTFARGAEQSDDITVLVMRVGEAPAGEGGALAS